MVVIFVHMRIEEHVTALSEHEENLKLAIERGLLKNQRNIGYNASQASVELFSIYMHKLNLIAAGENLDHRVFKSKEVDNRIPQDFPNKNMILELMRKLEEKRNVLCYGKARPENEIKEVVMAYNELKDMIRV